MLRDPDAYQPADWEHIFNHIHSVSTDELARPWAPVRRWSQYIWDSVAKGKCKWDDEKYIERARVRLCYTSSPTPSNINQQPAGTRSSNSGELAITLCRDFNGPQGCRHQHSQDDGKYKGENPPTHFRDVGPDMIHSRATTTNSIMVLDGGMATLDTLHLNRPPPPSRQGSTCTHRPLCTSRQKTSSRHVGPAYSV